MPGRIPAWIEIGDVVSDQLLLDDTSLELAAIQFVTVAESIDEDSVSVPVGLIEGLTDVGAQVSTFLRGVQAARTALGQAAHQGSRAAALLIEDSTTIDTLISDRLGDLVYPKARGS